MRLEAAFDSLTIASQLEGIDLQPTRGEIHLLAYLASLLSLTPEEGRCVRLGILLLPLLPGEHHSARPASGN